MMTTPIALDEDLRLAELRSYGILDTGPETDFDDIAQLTAQICEVPVALVSFVDAERQWFKARVGFDEPETERDKSFCSLAIRQNELFEVEDLHKDPRTRSHPLLRDRPDLYFYAGAPLLTETGLALGSLCVLDTRTRVLTDVQRRALRVLAHQVVRQLDARRNLHLAEMQSKEVDHRVKNSLQSVASYARLLSFSAESEETRRTLGALQGRIETVAALHEALYRTEAANTVDLGRYLLNVGGLLQAHCPPNITLSVEAGPAMVPSSIATACATIMNEIVANAIKHAFPGGAPGRIDVTGSRDGDSYILDCRDDGVGMPDEGRAGLGLRIIDAAAQQIGGTIATESAEPGHRLRITLPLE